MTLLLRIYSYLYHTVLSLFLLGLALVAHFSNLHNLRISLLPWKGEELTNWLLYGSLAGLLSVLLAVTGRFKYLLPIWALAVLFLMGRGVLVLASFDGRNEFTSALWLLAGAAGAFLASLTLLKKPRTK